MAANSVMTVALMFVIMFALNLLVMVVYFPPTQHQNIPKRLPGMLGNKENILRKEEEVVPLQTNSKPKQQITSDSNLKHQQQPPKPNKDHDCPSYGCPLYPPELTPQLNQSLTHAFQNNRSGPTFDVFSSETFAMLTQQGKSHTENQDRGLYISPFVIHDDDQESYRVPSFLAAVFDGHNRLGHLVAQEVAEQLPAVLAEKMRQTLVRRWWEDEKTDVVVAAALNHTFVQVNREGTAFNFLRGGTTASVTLRFGSKLYVANAGDSQTVLVSVESRRAKVEFATRKDKPFEEDEHDRIEKSGGKIHINPLHPSDARVVVQSKAAKDTIALAMSRSLGDWEWKEVGVTAEPIVNVIDLHQSRYKDASLFLIAASDGMWDVRKQEFYANQFATAFEVFLGDDTSRDSMAKNANGIMPPSNRLLRPIFKLHDIFQRITPKVQKGYCDDITAIIAKIY